MNVMIVVTHLLGTGHLARALTLARAFQNAGHAPIVVSGGMPAPQLDHSDLNLIQLSPVRSDGVNFTTLLDETGQPASERLMAHRGARLLEAMSSHNPDILITELFPFGRRILRDEFQALLAAAHERGPRPLVCASIRDILAPPSKPSKVALADHLIADWYDAVLVHSDKQVTPLELSWPVSKTLAAKLNYTGFVAPPAPVEHPQKVGRNEIIVSAGGGDVGARIFEMACQAAARDQSRNWRVLIGGADAEHRSQILVRTAPANVLIEPARPDFRQMLHHAAASVSMCGYNTALDILQTGCPAVFIPFDAGSEVEQGLRAEALAHLPAIAVLKDADLSPSRLADSVARISAAARRAPRLTGFEGAARTVEITTQMRAAMI